MRHIRLLSRFIRTRSFAVAFIGYDLLSPQVGIDKRKGASDEAPLPGRMRRLLSGSSVYLKAHRRLTREAMHMLHMRISMDLIVVFFMVLSPSLW